MKTTSIKDLMVPLSEYATVSQEATLWDAVSALEKAQEELDTSRYKYLHRAVLVYDEHNRIVGKIGQLDVLEALEPKYGEIGMGIMTGVSGEPWAVGLAVAFATSFAHFLIVGTPNNAIVYGLGVYPDSGEKMIHPMDFVKYGFVLFLISMVILWIVGFLGVFNLVGFPEGILETAKGVLQNGASN